MFLAFALIFVFVNSLERATWLAIITEICILVFGTIDSSVTKNYDIFYPNMFACPGKPRRSLLPTSPDFWPGCDDSCPSNQPAVQLSICIFLIVPHLPWKLQCSEHSNWAKLLQLSIWIWLSELCWGRNNDARGSVCLEWFDG